MTDAVTDEMKAYLATWLQTQDMSTLGHKAVRKHLNEHFGVDVDKDAFKTVLIEATAKVAAAGGASSNAADGGDDDAATTTKRAKRKSPSKPRAAPKAKAAPKKKKSDGENNDDGGAVDAGDAVGDADAATTTTATAATTDVLNEVFGDDDVDNNDNKNADNNDADAENDDAGDADNKADDEDAEMDDMEEKLFSKKRSRRESDGADARAAKRARKKAAAAAAADDADGDDYDGEEKPKKKKDKKKKEKKAAKKKAKKDDDAVVGDDGAEPKPKKKRAAAKKAKRAVVGDGDDDDGGAGGDSATPKPMSEVDELLEKMKRKEIKSTRTHDEKLASLLKLLDEMTACAERDVAAVLRKAPAVNKIMHIDEFVEALSKADLQTLFVGNGALVTIKSWLSPLPDGSLPSLKVREQLLRMLLILPVEREDLTESKVGHIVMFLLKHPEETRANRELCEQIVERWSRPIFERASDYSRMPAPDTYDTAPSSGAPRPPSSLHGGPAGGHFVPNDDDDAANLEVHPLTGRVRRPRVHVPRPLKLDFTLQPASRPEQRAVAQPSERKKELMSRLHSLKSKNGSIKRLQSVAVSRLEL
jgi:transcription factor SPN1